jgi:predicted naringenin-chalcone synthase
MLLADARTMQDALRRTTTEFDVVIASVATAVPLHKVSQATVAEGAMRVFPHLSGLAGLFANTGIESRYVCGTPAGMWRIGVVLRNKRGDRHSEQPDRGAIVAIGEYCWPDTEHIMGWDIKQNGFGVVHQAENILCCIQHASPTPGAKENPRIDQGLNDCGPRTDWRRAGATPWHPT